MLVLSRILFFCVRHLKLHDDNHCRAVDIPIDLSHKMKGVCTQLKCDWQRFSVDCGLVVTLSCWTGWTLKLLNVVFGRYIWWVEREVGGVGVALPLVFCRLRNRMVNWVTSTVEEVKRIRHRKKVALVNRECLSQMQRSSITQLRGLLELLELHCILYSVNFISNEKLEIH